MKNSADNLFQTVPVGPNEARLFTAFLDDHDFAPGTHRGFVLDLRKFAKWFSTANREPFTASRVTVRDVADFKDHLRRERGQAVATVNRCIVLVRRYFNWLVDEGHLETNPAKKVKQLKRQQCSPKGMERSQVRKLFREIELRQDIRAGAVFSMFLYTGARIGDLVPLELHDLILKDRSGSVVYRFGKGSKQRTVPVPLPARQAIQSYFETRPPVDSQRVFIGERGPLGETGYRALCDKYSVFIGIDLHPHLFRHTFAHQYLADNPGDLVGLAQILGHASLSTTSIYAQKSQDDLNEATDRLTY